MRRTDEGGVLFSSIRSCMFMALCVRDSLTHSGNGELLFMKGFTFLSLSKSCAASSVEASEVLSVAKA